jgi:hypothetical protein
MSTGPGSFSRHLNLDELNDPAYGVGGVLKTAATRKAEAIANLGITASAAELNIMDGVTATAAEINAAADRSANTSVVVVGGGAVTALTGGGTYLIPLVTANVTMTLPATPTLGEKHRLIFTGTAADAEDWVITAAAFFIGGVPWLTPGTPDIEAVYANGSTHNTLTVNNPAAGTIVEFIGNGTNWVAAGVVVSANTHAFSAV